MSKKYNNPWMPASNNVFGGGGDYDKNAYSARGRGAANNPWVQGSGWWETIVEGNYQGGFGQATQSNEYYSTRPVSPAEMRRMRTISVILAGGAVVGAAAAAGLFAGGGGAAAAGGAVAGAGGTTGAGAGIAGGGFLSGAGGAIAGGAQALGAAIGSVAASSGAAVAAGAAAGALAANSMIAASQATGMAGGGVTSGGMPNALTNTGNLSVVNPANSVSPNSSNPSSAQANSQSPQSSNPWQDPLSPMQMPVGSYGMSSPGASSGGYANTSGSNGYANSGSSGNGNSGNTRNPDRTPQTETVEVIDKAPDPLPKRTFRISDTSVRPENLFSNEMARISSEVMNSQAISPNSIAATQPGDVTLQSQPGTKLLKNFHFGNMLNTLKPSAEPAPWYGNFIGPGPNVDPFTLGKPINTIDAAARIHDKVYYDAQVGGIEGAFFSSKVLNADLQLIENAKQVINDYFNKKIDDYTQKPTDFESFLVAIAIRNAFTEIVTLKYSGAIPMTYNAMKDGFSLVKDELLKVYSILIN